MKQTKASAPALPDPVRAALWAFVARHGEAVPMDPELRLLAQDRCTCDLCQAARAALEDAELADAFRPAAVLEFRAEDLGNPEAGLLRAPRLEVDGCPACGCTEAEAAICDEEGLEVGCPVCCPTEYPEHRAELEGGRTPDSWAGGLGEQRRGL